MSDAGPNDDDDHNPGPKVGGFPMPPLDECPIVFLGHFDDKVVFAMPEGQIREVKASDVPKLLKVDLFNRRDGQVFLNYWRDAEEKFAREQCAVWFVRHCREAGYWDRTRPQRGLGVWPGKSGSVILHRGQELWTFWPSELEPHEIATVADAMRAPNGPIYRLQPPTPAPDESSTVEDGQWIRQKLDAWNWEAVGDDGLTGADIIAGWVGCALMGSVAPFRPHVLLFALFGSGKTTLIRFVHALLSALAGDVIDSFTRAGLANDLAGMARPVIIDEAEASVSFNGPGPVEEALDLIRRMATGDGGTKKMGAIGGGSVTQTAVGSVMMGAVNPVKLGSADASRIAEVKLLPIDAATPGSATFRPTADVEIDKAIKTARMLAPALLGRVLRQSARYLADVAMLKAAFRKQGQSPRAADLVAALAAGRRLLTSDDPLDELDAADEAVFWAGLLASRDQAEMVSNPGADCLAHLLAYPSGKHEHDRVVSLGELVSKWWSAEKLNLDNRITEDVLKEFGIRPVMDPDAAGDLRPWLQVANSAPMLSRIFERTSWRDWRRTLGYLDALGPAYKTRPGVRARFGFGVQQRSTMIPLTPWIGDDAEPSRERHTERHSQDDE